MNGIRNLCTQQQQLPESDLRPTILKLHNIRMQRGRRNVLNNVNLTIRRGDFLAITGPNGGGKTTLIRIILNLLKPTSGKVEYIQKGLRTSYLPQKSSIDYSYPIIVREVIASGLLANFATHNATDRVEEIIELLELTDHANKPIGALSGGQQQRTLLARAIISDPELLILDEPLSYVDKQFENKIYNIIAKLAERTTILMVTHEITRVASMANRHIIVNGEITECPSAHHFVKIALCE
ncbi:MAG: metal ABC transporter ATP-binding protein [Bacteroidales bacterium]|nr:metal ABC transporter ATP-binding protein [Bacteroidales bacterium]